MKYISPYLSIPDQKSVGFCVSCGFTTMMEIFEMNIRKTENVPELSRMFLQAECKARDGCPNTDGTYMTMATTVLRNVGVCEEHMLPFDVDKYLDNGFPTRTQAMKDNAKENRIKSYTTTRNLDTIKAHILKYGACTMEEYFYNMDFSKNVLVGLGNKSNGQHCTCIIGFDDEFEYMGFKGAFVRLNGNNPMQQYGFGVEIIPYKFFETKWFMNAYLCTPYEHSDYLRNKYNGIGIQLPQDKVELTIGSNIAYINGVKKEVSPAPLIDNGTTLVPFRFCGQAFRKVDVDYNNSTKTISVSSQEGTFYFKLNDTNVRDSYGNIVYTMPIAPKLVNNSTMMPIRAFGEILNAKVDYNNKTKKITLIK